MKDSITITREEAAVFRALITEKIGLYAGYASGAESESEYYMWADAAGSFETLERQILQRLEEADK